MTPTEFLLLALALSGLVIVAMLISGRRNEPEPEPAEVTRWRRFRVHAGELMKGQQGSLVAEEEPDGIRLRLIASASEAVPLLAGKDAAGPEQIALKRRWFSLRALWTLRIKGRAWILMKLPAGSEFPVIQPARAHLHASLPEPGSIEFHGSLEDREYEMRLDGKLAASVSWQEGEESPPGESGCYCVEVIKGAEPLPLIALALALEIAAAGRGSPVKTDEVEEIDADVESS